MSCKCTSEWKAHNWTAQGPTPHQYGCPDGPSLPGQRSRNAYVIIDSYGRALYAAPNFERALERVGVLMREEFNTTVMFRIQKVEAE